MIMPLEPLKLGRTYRHYKTKGLYIPLQLVKNTGDNLNDCMMVLYFSLSANSLFVRPLKEFVAHVDVKADSMHHGATQLVPRFELLESGSERAIALSAKP